MNWLFSYNGSGSNYVRYCIEFLSKLPTQGPIRLIHPSQNYILYRSHHLRVLSPSDRCGVLIRNPFELIFRENILNNSNESLDKNMHKICERYQLFLEIIDNPEFFYYEKIIDNFDDVKKILDYFKIPLVESIDDFEINLDYHKKTSYLLGNTYYSDSSKIFYSKNITRIQYNKLHNIILSYPENVIKILNYYLK